MERLDAGDPPNSPEEDARGELYERLIARLRDLEQIEPPPGWEDRAVARWRRSSRRRRPGIRGSIEDVLLVLGVDVPGELRVTASRVATSMPGCEYTARAATMAATPDGSAVQRSSPASSAPM